MESIIAPGEKSLLIEEIYLTNYDQDVAVAWATFKKSPIYVRRVAEIGRITYPGVHAFPGSDREVSFISKCAYLTIKELFIEFARKKIDYAVVFKWIMFFMEKNDLHVEILDIKDFIFNIVCMNYYACRFDGFYEYDDVGVYATYTNAQRKEALKPISQTLFKIPTVVKINPLLSLSCVYCYETWHEAEKLLPLYLTLSPAERDIWLKDTLGSLAIYSVRCRYAYEKLLILERFYMHAYNTVALPNNYKTVMCAHLNSRAQNPIMTFIELVAEIIKNANGEPYCWDLRLHPVFAFMTRIGMKCDEETFAHACYAQLYNIARITLTKLPGVTQRTIDKVLIHISNNCDDAVPQKIVGLIFSCGVKPSLEAMNMALKGAVLSREFKFANVLIGQGARTEPIAVELKCHTHAQLSANKFMTEREYSQIMRFLGLVPLAEPAVKSIKTPRPILSVSDLVQIARDLNTNSLNDVHAEFIKRTNKLAQ